MEEVSLRPELSIPPRFRIQGGYPERYGGARTEILVSNIGYYRTIQKSYRIAVNGINGVRQLLQMSVMNVAAVH